MSLRDDFKNLANLVSSTLGTRKLSARFETFKLIFDTFEKANESQATFQASQIVSHNLCERKT